MLKKLLGWFNIVVEEHVIDLPLTITHVNFVSHTDIEFTLELSEYITNVEFVFPDKTTWSFLPKLLHKGYFVDAKKLTGEIYPVSNLNERVLVVRFNTAHALRNLSEEILFSNKTQMVANAKMVRRINDRVTYHINDFTLLSHHPKLKDIFTNGAFS